MALKEKFDVSPKDMVDAIEEKKQVEVPLPNVSEPEEIAEKKFNYRLVVVNPFDRYMRGNVIYKDQEIQAVIDNGKLRHCSKRAI